MDLAAGRDVINQSLTVKQEYASVNTSGSYTTLSNQASITASGALAIKAGRDVSDTGGTIAGASVGIGGSAWVSLGQLGSAWVSLHDIANDLPSDERNDFLYDLSILKLV